MEELLKDNVYVIDLSHINSVPEIIFELSSVLDKNEAKNRKICLKFGEVSLNQAQLLSIKSLISGIDSILTAIDTESEETEKVALSLGIIVSNALNENSSEIMPEMTYKTAEEYKESVAENIDAKSSQIEEKNGGNSDIVYDEKYIEAELSADKFLGDNYLIKNINNIKKNKKSYNCSEDKNEESNEKTSDTGINEKNDENYGKKQHYDDKMYEIKEEPEYGNVCEFPKNTDKNQETVSEEGKTETLVNDNNDENIETSESAPDINQNNVPQKEEIVDELEVIFGSNPLPENIFDASQFGGADDKEGFADIIVPENEYTKEDIELEEFSTKYIKQTVRSGQVINYEGNIVIIGDCHPGCEIKAFGDITVWGILSGIAHAGAGGNKKARVRALKMNAIQLRIADCYSRRPDSLNTVYIEKTDSFTPEEARIVNGEIVVFKLND